MNGAIGRIILRYGAGTVFGATLGSTLAADPDLAMVVGTAASVLVAGIVEGFYALAKKKGWTL